MLTRLVAVGASLAMAAALAACGGEDRQDAAIEPGEFDVRVVNVQLDPIQRLARTNMMRLAVENTGVDTIPNLTVTVKVLGREGEESGRPFAYRDPQENLALHDRPIWSLDLGYPRLAGGGELGGSGSASARTFQFGELPPGEIAPIVWRLTPVKAGRYRLTYEIAADLHGVGMVSDETGGPPGGLLVTRILAEPERLRVTGDGRVVQINALPGERPQVAPPIAGRRDMP